MIKKIVILFSVLLCQACSTSDSSQSNSTPLSSENKILAFNINSDNNTFIGTINQTTRVITVVVSEVDLSSFIIPTIEISPRASISPALNAPQNFNNTTITYTVTAENGDEATYEVNAVRGDNKILSFVLSIGDSTYEGSIDHQTKVIAIETIGLESTTSLIPEIGISPSATISPDATMAQNFNDEILYTITSQSGDEAIYSVEVTNTPFTTGKQILSFQFIEDGLTFDGVIDHDDLTIHIESYKNIINITPIISLSENASITPNSNETQDFRNTVEYTVVAQDGSSNTYSVYTKGVFLYSINSARSTSDLHTKYFSKATPYVRCSFVDLTIPNSKIVLENDLNSYELSYSDYSTSDSSTFEITYTFFELLIPDNIVTGNNYKLRYKVNGVLKAEAEFLLDIVSENVPDIDSSNQQLYNRFDTMILTGNNLLPGLRITKIGSSVYNFDEDDVTVSSDNTTLSFYLEPPQFFYSQNADEFQVIIFHNDRYGETINLDFD